MAMAEYNVQTKFYVLIHIRPTISPFIKQKTQTFVWVFLYNLITTASFY